MIAIEISFNYRNDFQRVKFHQYEAITHTYKSATALVDKMKYDTSVVCISF